MCWSDGEEGYDPEDLIIDRFGLNYDFIIKNRFTWIDNLVTGSGKDLADPGHKNNKMPYVRDYLRKVGARKCEANVIVTMPEVARDLVTGIIEKYLGDDSLRRFYIKRAKINEEYEELLDDLEIREPITAAIQAVNDSE